MGSALFYWNGIFGKFPQEISKTFASLLLRIASLLFCLIIGATCSYLLLILNLAVLGFNLVCGRYSPYVVPPVLLGDWKPPETELSLIAATALQPRLTQMLPQHRIGAGSEGVVYRATYENKLVVAVKLAKSPDHYKHLQKESKILSKLKHENLPKIFGRTTDGNDAGIVMEYAPRGTLSEFLATHKEAPLDWNQRISIALCIANALTYLHGLRPKILHRDIKGPNILLREDLTAFLTDFGTAKEKVTTDTIGSKQLGSWSWMSPEMLMDDELTTLAVDIYSLGMVFYELLTHRLPFDGQRPQIWERPKYSVKEKPVLGCPEGYIQLMQDCWAASPSSRPTARDVTYRLELIQQECFANIPPRWLDPPPSQMSRSHQVGAGAFGTVYRVMYFRREKYVAVKCLHGNNRSVATKALLKEYQRMIDLTATQESHYNLPVIYGFIVDKDLAGIVMEYADKGSLRNVLASPPTLSWRKRLSIALDCAHALEHLHDRKIIHRDLKGANIMIREDGSAFITDFGLSKEVKNAQTSGIGTSGYMAPEMLEEGKDITVAIDIYAFGMVLFELYTLQIPFVGVAPKEISKRVLQGQRPPVPLPMSAEGSSIDIDGCPLGYLKLMRECWDQDPTRRPNAAAISARLAVLREEVPEAKEQKEIKHDSQLVTIKAKELDPAPKKMTRAHILSNSPSGYLYRATYKQQNVVVKWRDRQDQNDTKMLEKEYNFRLSLAHENLPRLYGFTMDGADAGIVMECAELGPLDKALEDKKKYAFTWTRRVSIALSIVKVLGYLHGQTPPVLCQGLKSSDIMIRDDWTVFIIEIFPPDLAQVSIGTTQLGEIRWVPPEMLLGQGISPAVDVYSVGLLLYTLLTRQVPFHNIAPGGMFGAVLSLDPAIPSLTAGKDCPRDYVQLMQECWNKDHSKRPSLKNIEDRLTLMQQEAKKLS